MASFVFCFVIASTDYILVNSCHIFYSQRIVDISDGKPKWSGLDDDSELMEDVEPENIESVVGKDKVT